MKPNILQTDFIFPWNLLFSSLLLFHPFPFCHSLRLTHANCVAVHFVVALPCEFRLLSVDVCLTEGILFLLVLLLHTLCIIRMHLRHWALLFFYCKGFFLFFFLLYVSRSLLSAYLFSTFSLWPSCTFLIDPSVVLLHCFIYVFSMQSVIKRGKKHWKSHKTQRFNRTPFFFLFRLMLLFSACAMQSSENKKFIFISQNYKKNIHNCACVYRTMLFCSVLYTYLPM